MKVLVLALFVCALSIALHAQGDSALCAPSPEVAQDLRRADVGRGKPTESSLAERQRILEELVKKYPDDLFVHRQLAINYFSLARQMELVEQYRKLEEAHPGNVQYEYLYARALDGVNTPQALAIFEKVNAAAPDFPWAYPDQAYIHGGGKFANHEAGRKELDHFFSICPNSMDKYVWLEVQQYDNAEMAAKYGHKLRERLLSDTNPEHVFYWKMVWEMDFKAAPAAEHPGIRKQVGNDVALLEKGVPRDAERLSVLESGYRQSEDSAGEMRIEEELLQRYPESLEADQIRGNRWRKEHPRPGPSASDAQQQAYYRVWEQHTEELLQKRPQDSWLLLYRFMALRELPETTGDQLTEAATQLLQAMRTDPIWQAWPPVRFQIAEAFNQKKIHSDQVPGLVAEGLQEEADHKYKSDHWPDDNNRDADIELKTRAADLLVGAAKGLGNPEIARKAVADLDQLDPKNSEQAAEIWAVKGKFAELEGRKLDALLMYEAAIKARPADFHAEKGDLVAANAARLWKELGGSDAGRELWSKKSKATSVAQESSWTSPGHALAAWELSDLSGHVWKLKSLEGKTVLISVWASWCGPCQMELPEFQKLYDQMKDRKDVQVLSFNIDDEVGKVEPFVKEKGYTFPVLLAKDYVFDSLEPGVPRTLIVDQAGVWKWEQTGFSGKNASWRDEVQAKIMGMKVSQ